MFIPQVDPTRLADVLAGVPYPASTWQLLAQADYYGADRSGTRMVCELSGATRVAA